MNKISVGCMQITWQKFMAQDKTFTEARVLAEIAQAGYEGAAASPKAGRTPEETMALYERYGLRPAPGYLGADFWIEDQRQEILERAKQHAAFAKGVGCTEWFVAAGGFDYLAPSGKTRWQVSGHVSGEDGMTDAEYERFAEVLTEVGEVMLEQGVRACFHNHVGTVIETREEIERLLSLVDPEVVFLGPDTGHLAWAGVDVTAFCQDYANRIKTMHLKDIHLEVARQAREQKWDYQTAVREGLFAELGEGFVDFPAVLAILREAGFAGWVIAETDVTQKPTALASVTISRNYLRSIGL